MDEVAAVEREVGDLFGGNHLAERGIRGFDGDLGGADLDILSDRRGVEREIDFALLVDLEPDVPLLGGLEALRLHVDGVVCHGQQRHEVVAGIVGPGFAGEAGFLRVNFHGRAGDDGAGFVGNGSGKTAVGLAKEK